MNRLPRRFVLGALLAGIASPLAAAAPATSLRPRLRPGGLGEVTVPDGEALIGKAGLTGRSSFALARVGTPALLESHDAETPLPPASVGKCLTALYALEALGPAHRFTTRVLGTGPLRNGRLEGDLILVGGGDPGLDTNDLAELAARLKAAGLREVSGRFLVHGASLPEARLIDASQPDHLGYNPGVSALNLNYNRVHFEWKQEAGKWRATMDARTDRYRPEVAIASMQIVDRDSPVYTYADRDGRDTWTVARGALGTGGSRWLPVRRPAAYAAEVFASLARSGGLVLKTPEMLHDLPAGTAELARHESPPLEEIAELMLRYSNNLTAEVLGLAASAQASGRPASIRASAAAMSDWARRTYGLREVAMVDHSGLGDASRFPTGDLVRLLSQPRAAGFLRPILKDIPLLDEKGRKVVDPRVSVVAKTGTLNFVSGLAGYASTGDGAEYAFAILSGDVPRRDALSRAERESPRGGKAWLTRARRLQQALLDRWGQVYGAG
ncbi:D-alanyl-D-alanine carboxypeptidase/D-alanyl-D-alanine endopeptidase [Oceanicola sp. S124]|uniref:D-alanyl-D-alanine carboxypeptidase/D-alanyl-D-alanine endopeptidase n=1 Tax=Oceanicola sp. S124 TaxID=1042378 RepID=UPI00058FDDC6|nr:D-alanyl-D-alanine carboxypeptidase/D-alanyl-D-alanine-endopeptidase [Oceanicola sp. S124]